MYLKLGRADWARDSFVAGVKFKPKHVGFASNILLCEQYLPDMTLAKMVRTHGAWAKTYAEPLRGTWPVHHRDRDPNRRLRLGFVSADLGFHPVGCFFLPLLENLDRQKYETLLYAAKKNPDFQAERLSRATDQWRQIHDLSETDLAALIERDEVDILFDLSGHTAHHRLLTFARKPAPVQASWIGYAGTTGFSAIDYLLADRFQIPPESEPYYSEKVLRLPNAWVCFEPPMDAPELGPLPAATSGAITFGSFNFLAKVTPNVVEVWADILKRVPNSRLILLYRGFDAELARTRFRELFTSCGIEESRVQLLGTHPHTDVMRRYQEVDIALDPFPYSGGLTTCEALWMGVPVVTCPGETFASRHSLSLMSNIGITETIAANMDDYVRIAVELAGDLPRLADLRHRLRGQMAGSPLCDAPAFTRAFERSAAPCGAPGAKGRPRPRRWNRRSPTIPAAARAESGVLVLAAAERVRLSIRTITPLAPSRWRCGKFRGNGRRWTWPEARFRAEPENGLSAAAPLCSHVARLPFTEMIIKETLRLYPPTWSLVPRCPTEEIRTGRLSHSPRHLEIHQSLRHAPRPAVFFPRSRSLLA